jgi:hypothetical protein
MSDNLKLISALLWRIVWLFLPCTEAAFAAFNKDTKTASLLTNEVLRESTASHSDFILTVACVIVLILGSTIGYFFPTPQYGAKPIPKPIKLLISITCGFIAFVYYIHSENEITTGVIFWVAGVSFVSPAIIHLFHAAMIKKAEEKTGVTEEDLERIKKTFRDEA